MPNIKKAIRVIENRKLPTRDMKVKLRGSKARITPSRRAAVRR